MYCDCAWDFANCEYKWQAGKPACASCMSTGMELCTIFMKSWTILRFKNWRLVFGFDNDLIFWFPMRKNGIYDLFLFIHSFYYYVRQLLKRNIKVTDLCFACRTQSMLLVINHFVIKWNWIFQFLFRTANNVLGKNNRNLPNGKFRDSRKTFCKTFPSLQKQ